MLSILMPYDGFGLEQTDSLPEEVAAFIKQRDLCDHYRGEDPYDEERKKFLEKNIIELCAGTDSRLAYLKLKYHKYSRAMELLKHYEIDIEPNN